MRLDAWLRKDPSVVERLHVVELLARGVNEAHGRGEQLAGLEPSRIEVSGASCDLADALAGPAARHYLAPEREGDGPATAASDVYAAGAIVWETLVGRPYAASPSHLSEARPDLPGDLCDAVMACLESSPDWRPADLSYVAELASQAAGQRGGSRASAPKATPKPAAARSDRPKKTGGRSSPTFDGRGREASRSQVPLIAAAVVLLAGAGAGYFWMTREKGSPSPPPAVTPTAAAAQAPSVAAPTAEPAPAAPPAMAAATAQPGPSPTPTTAPRATPAPAGLSAPAAPARAVTAEPAPTTAAPTTPAATTTALAPPPAAAPVTASAPAAAADAPRESAVLATLSPLAVKRPGRVLFDLHGTGLTADLHARLVGVRDSPHGMMVVRQKCSGTLCNVLVELDDSVKPAAYAIVLEDAQGRQSNALTFTVTK